ncbi:MAG: HAD family hydrolase [Phyllobacteriaceae bacterium]|nr:HAD family hydrolase [Phyllobacteriaceae bacterium]
MSGHRIRAILFDKDGTLLDFNATWLGFARDLALSAADGDMGRADLLLREGGYDEDENRFRSGSVFAAGTNAEVVKHFHPHLDGEPLRSLVAETDRKTAGVAERAVALPGAVDAVRALHAAGFAIGLATNDSTAGAKRTLEAFGVADLFVAALGYDAVDNPKPAADPCILFAKRAGVTPKEVAVVGDNAHDLEMARAAGAGLSVGVLSGNGTRENLAPLADVVLDSVGDLPAWLADRR